MTEDFVSLGRAFFSGVWGMFSVPVPGLGLTVGELSVGVALIGVSIGVIRLIFGFGGGPETPRTGSTSHPRISKNRRDDEF